jgi:small subunit ribosomal protein S5
MLKLFHQSPRLVKNQTFLLRSFAADAKPSGTPAAAGAAKPAAAASASAAKPAAKKGAAKGGAGNAKADKLREERVKSAPNVYLHGDKDRPIRQAVREAERADRFAALAEQGLLPKEFASATSPAMNVVANDPILKAFAQRESRVLVDKLGIGEEDGSKVLAGPAKEGEAGSGIEEPHEISSLVATKRFSNQVAASLPEEFRSRIVFETIQDADALLTDGSDDEALAEAAKAEGGSYESSRQKGSSDTQGRASPYKRPLRPILPSVPGAVEAEAQAAEMAATLLKGSARKGDESGNGGEVASTPAARLQTAMGIAAKRALRLVYDPVTGAKRTPLHAAGLDDGSSFAAREDAKRRLRDWKRYNLGLDPLDPNSEEGEQAAREAELTRLALLDTEEGRKLNGPWGDDPMLLPDGILEELANPYDFYGHEATEPSEDITTEREAAMTPEERTINAQRKKLRDLIEKPMPVATRPLWPLHGLIAGTDQVQQVVAGGMVASTRSMVVVGNQQGGVGFGMAKHKDAFQATKQALMNAQRDMVHIATHRGGFYHDLIGKKNNVMVIIRAQPASSHVFKGAPLIMDVFELAGITRASAKIVGSHRRSPYVVTQALFDAFSHHYPPEAEASMRGLRMQWSTADRLNPRTSFPYSPRGKGSGPRYQPANNRFIKN